jgi:hypothetical protein
VCVCVCLCVRACMRTYLCMCVCMCVCARIFCAHMSMLLGTLRSYRWFLNTQGWLLVHHVGNSQGICSHMWLYSYCTKTHTVVVWFHACVCFVSAYAYTQLLIHHWWFCVWYAMLSNVVCPHRSERVWFHTCILCAQQVDRSEWQSSCSSSHAIKHT